ncbi:hypothetical protein PIB30_064494 [Stylosanthes scabra]|uniref:Uncharacterized protein n=1 Tax=Stylosanthes scabra TaxID=79078 RepID=A0ABU6UKK7_9FABA|nr:hypothetical protein [Stylosanthes scabra]
MSKSGGANNTSSAATTDRDELGIIVTEEAEHVKEQSPGLYKRELYRAAISGDWVKASSHNQTHPNWMRIPLTDDGDTALHMAVSMEQTTFVEKLIMLMSVEDMEILKVDGNTAFSMAAISGNVEIAKLLLQKNPRLAWIKGHKNMLPIELASSVNQPLMVSFLFQRTTDDIDVLLHVPFPDIVRLFFLALTTNTYSKSSIYMFNFHILLEL